MMEDQEANAELTSQFLTFQKNAPLRAYIARKNTSFPLDCFTMNTLLVALKNIIRDEKLYDHGNVTMVLCSPDLEAALEVASFHVVQLRDILAEQLQMQLKLCVNYSFKALQARQLPKRSRLTVKLNYKDRDVRRVHIPPGNNPVLRELQPTLFSMWSPVKWEMKPELREVLLAELDDPSQTLFTYNHVTRLLDSYFYNHQLLDRSNDSVYIIKSTPLEKIFHVHVFAAWQLPRLLLPLLTSPVDLQR